MKNPDEQQNIFSHRKKQSADFTTEALNLKTLKKNRKDSILPEMDNGSTLMLNRQSS